MIPIRAVLSSSNRVINSRTLSTTSSIFAGHSHWQNVRHIKAAKDKEKSNKIQQFTSTIRKAIRENQPSGRIKDLVASARAAQVPQASIDRALKSDDVCDPYVTAARASGGIFVLIESTCGRVKRERQLMSSVLKKFGFKLSENDSAVICRDYFDHLGIIICEPNEKIADYDQALEIGLEVGAEEVECVHLSDTEKVFQFQSDPRQVSQVAQELLKEHGVTVIESEDRHIPKDLVQISPEVYKSIEDMYSKMRETCDAVDRFFDNVEIA